MLLQNRLALHRFTCREFGYENLRAMLDRLRDVPAQFTANGESEYARALYVNPNLAKVSPQQLSEYDANIAALSRKLRMIEEDGRCWKSYQYLALLFTEHYLNRYFDDPEKLCHDLNMVRAGDRQVAMLPKYEPDDLRTIAFQSATGSGKTLLMHAHILQYRHYLGRSGKRLNNIVLLTPNEQMSVQHERELHASGLRARLFSAETGADLFSHVEIIDLNKLAEKKGVKRVAVQDFGDNNLVMVDEGHLGASGKVWRERRKELSRGGFTFEYSATFNQVVSKKDIELLDAYGKCLLFDYTYRQFHEDGYGKDYAISNLPGGMEDASSHVYLLGCLLTFYQQYRIWLDQGARWTSFNVTKPLWVFLGKTVTGSSKADRETRSDAILILDFLAWTLANGNAVRHHLDNLLRGQSGLPDEQGKDYFAGRFSYLERNPKDDLYADLCDTLFHGLGKLHVVYLTAGEGELHLRSADNPAFGVVNIGDSTALHRLLVEKANPDISIEREAGFVQRLFADVDRPASPVNVVIGARRFIAGWNSWRVSTMGLMHVGVGEGPEIIQMFGRGVRLKGWNMSLKRHQRSGAELPQDGADLAELETLYIFGLRANYMQAFRTLLEKEGMRVEETISLPVTWNFGKHLNLKLIRVKDDRKFEFSDKRPILPNPGDTNQPLVILDLYPRLQSVASGEASSDLDFDKDSVKLEPRHTVFFDKTRIYDRLLARKQQNNWHNLVIRPETVDQLLQDNDWYTLYMPQERLALNGFQGLKELEEIAVELITEYADQFWRSQRHRWESDRMEVVTLDEDDPNNVRSYDISVEVTQERLIKDIHELKENVRENYFRDLKLGVIMANIHAYQPLLYSAPDCPVTVRPVALNENEKKVVERLKELAEGRDPCLQDRELYLIRNLTRSRGVSFFDDSGYYPDFIVWLKDKHCQHVVFLDPKGLGRYGSRERKKVQLHHDIHEIEKRVQNTDPDLRLSAYVLSVTPSQKIDDGARPPNEWKQDGVYFLNEPDCLKQVITDVSERGSRPH